MNVLELYSGIGGMHYAIKETGISAEVISAIDINVVANTVYRHNFDSSISHQRNIVSLSAGELQSIQPNIIMMSPPCQPFTRVGLKKDIYDGRTDSFLHVLDILPDLNSVQYILLENVKGFETSEARNKLVSSLDCADFTYQEFILSPHNFGIPNTRHRYYIIAKRKPKTFCFVPSKDVMTALPFPLDCEVPVSVQEMCRSRISKLQKKHFGALKITSFEDEPFTIKQILETDVHESNFLLNSKILAKRASILDIVTPMSRRSCCFTKAYGHYIEGTGSVFCPFTSEFIEHTFKRSQNLEIGSQEYVDVLSELKLRFFTPKEITRLMCFPDSFSFPENITIKQKYRLLGNSINVHVVAILFELLMANI